MTDDAKEDVTEAVESDVKTLEQRIGRLEYDMSRIPDHHKMVRSPITNPIDDPDDAPYQVDDKGRPTEPGTWDGHPWNGA